MIRHSSGRCELHPNLAESTQFKTSHSVWYGQHPGWQQYERKFKTVVASEQSATSST